MVLFTSVRISCASSFLLLLLMQFLQIASPIVIEEKKYKQLIEGQGLYSADDDVEILTDSNFKSKLYGKNRAWIIQFYNSRSRSSVNFTSTWITFAKDWHLSKHLIAIGAMDCGNADNEAICRCLSITEDPSLRYFHENYIHRSSNLGVTIEIKNGTFKQRLVNQMVHEQKNGRGKMFPDLIPYVHSRIFGLFNNLPSRTTKYVLLILEDRNSTYGPELALKLQTVSQIAVKYSLPNNTKLLEYFMITDPPAMALLSMNRDIIYVEESITKQNQIISAMKLFLRRQGVRFPIHDGHNQIPYTGKWYDGELLDLDVSTNTNDDALYQMDLETTLRYSLKNEVGSVKTIKGEQLEALERYLTVLAKYFPLGRRGQRFLFELRDIVSTANAIDGSRIVQEVTEVESGSGLVFSTPQRWMSCRSSLEARHGYPCGVWKLFHYLTVRAAEKNGRNRHPAHKTEVLKAIVGYVQHFFECRECGKRFTNLAVETDMEETASLDSSILWLWMVHNKMNNKQSFPAKTLCPSCKYENATWSYQDVLEFTKKMYCKSSINYDGSDVRILQMDLEMDRILHVLLYVLSFIASLVLFAILSCTIIKTRRACDSRGFRRCQKRLWQDSVQDQQILVKER